MGTNGLSAALNKGAAQKDPLSGFYICDGDDSTATKYYGYANDGGGWYISKWDTVANTYRYAFGAGDYIASWDGRADLTYDYIFNKR